MTGPLRTRLPEKHRWLRLADESWDDPLDPSFAQHYGGRWNPPHSYLALYLNEDLETARAQIHRMLEGSPVRAEDLDRGYVLLVATLPSRQDVADGDSDEGLNALGLPTTYPHDSSGKVIPHEVCQPIGTTVHDSGLRGARARSAATHDGSGRELAWFPARTSSKASQICDAIPFSQWWIADTLPISPRRNA